jgi:hypothetical protein
MQALPTDGVPISTCTNPDEAWLDVARGLLKVVDQLLKVDALKEAESIARKRASPPAQRDRNEEYEGQLIRFLSEYKKYWFSPVKIKSMADKVPEAKGLSALDVNIIIDYCESLTKKGVLSVMYNAKRSRIYKIA